MDRPIEIMQGCTYIFKGKEACNDRTYLKLQILEVTDSTYLILNVDSEVKYRRGIVDFNYDYSPIEVTENRDQLIQRLISEHQ